MQHVSHNKISQQIIKDKKFKLFIFIQAIYKKEQMRVIFTRRKRVDVDSIRQKFILQRTPFSYDSYYSRY